MIKEHTEVLVIKMCWELKLPGCQTKPNMILDLGTHFSEQNYLQQTKD